MDNYRLVLFGVFIIKILIIRCSAIDQTQENLNPNSICPIYIMISSLTNHVSDSRIEITWGPNCEKPPEWIGLYNENPSLTKKPPIDTIIVNAEQYGLIRTNVSLGIKFKLSTEWQNRSVNINDVKTECLPYYVASFIGKRLITMNCLKIEPNWMGANENIHDIPLKRLLIPGTHCSGCYYNRSSHQSTIIKNHGISQSFDIWTQLVFGVRYLNFHISYSKDNREHFWISNENILIQPFINVIKDIKQFLQITNEVIILDINKFPIGFYKHEQNHKEFIEFLTREFDEFIYHRNDNVFSYDLTINDIREANKNIIILCNAKEEIIKNTTIVWPPLQQYSTESLQSTEIMEYMKNLFRNKYAEKMTTNKNESIGWVLMGIQGIESSLVEHKKIKNTRERSYETNQKVSAIIGCISKANIVALDFVMSSTILDIAIDVNRNNFPHNSQNFTNFEII